MSKRVSIAEARDHLPALIRSAEHGEPVELTRRGKMVAVLVSSRDYERLTTGPPDLWAAIQKFRAEHDLSDLDIEEVFADVRDRTPGREVEW
ncbi:MAG: type II toxin-antitoxin system Phd/YefM family antitoxin [Thermoanaerobaculia bacterium]